MAGEWKTVTLRDALGAKGYIRGPFGSALRRPELKSSGIPVYEQQHAITGTREFRFYIDEEKYSTLRRFAVQPNDLIVSCSGTLARVSMIREEDPVGIISQALLILRPDTSVVWPKYLYYFMSSKRGYDSLVGVSTGSVQVNIAGRSVIEQTELPLPPLPHQRAIACILGALDDKIELNRRMNETLEQIAQAIFKIWFIEPTKNARQKDGGQGLPEGWRIGYISDLCEVTIGGDWGEDEPFDGSIEVICLRGVDLEYTRKTGWANAPRRWLKESSLSKRSLDEKDVLVAASGAGPTGRPLWTTNDIQSAFDLPIVYSNFCKRLRCRSVAYAVYIDRILYIMRESGEIWEYVTGTSVPNLDVNSLLRMKEIPIPPANLLERYLYFYRPITKRLYSNESRTLAALRDALLPKLISGELRVPDAEKICARGASALGGMERCV